MILLLIGCFISVLLTVGAIGYWFLRQPEKAAETRESEATPSILLEPIGRDTETLSSSLADTLKTIGERFAASGSAASPYAKKLLMAGYRNPSAGAIFYGVKCLLAAVVALPLAVWSGAQGQGISGGLLAALGGGGFAWFVPDRILEWQMRRRQGNLRRSLPPALDLMVLGLEAGQGLDQVMADTSRELRRAYPELALEFASVPGEIRAGKARVEVLKTVAFRNQEPELSKVINLLIDGDRFGTSLAPALRDHARHMRTRRRQDAQEQARKTSVKLVFPVFFLIFPSVLLVTLGPAVLTLMGSLQKMLEQ